MTEDAAEAKQVRDGDRAGRTAGRSTPVPGKKLDAETRPGYDRPLSPLGEELVKIREEIVASGEPLLSWEDLEREIAERRGEVA